MSGRASRRPQEPVVVHTVTTAPQAPFDDHDQRARRYVLTMTIRTICFVLMVVFDGWLRWAFLAGAAILPYIAVVLANAKGNRVRGQVGTVLPRHDQRHIHH